MEIKELQMLCGSIEGNFNDYEIIDYPWAD